MMQQHHWPFIALSMQGQDGAGGWAACCLKLSGVLADTSDFPAFDLLQGCSVQHVPTEKLSPAHFVVIWPGATDLADTICPAPAL